jgi:hypothetical protein
LDKADLNEIIWMSVAVLAFLMWRVSRRVRTLWAEHKENQQDEARKVSDFEDEHGPVGEKS